MLPFTLVELLTVLAIVGILATLLMSALSTAKKKSRVAASISNLRQIAIAFTLYQDDHAHRPLTWDVLLSSGYLGSERILKCLEDKTRKLGESVQPDMTGNVATNQHSYLYPLPWDDWAWNRIVKSGAHAGLAACQLHGVGRPDPEAPSMLDFEGLVLRAQLDGAVVRREVYWGAGMDAAFESVGCGYP
jgi:prepilin-type N-terminal cleavage/methylation domain-containing protein